MYPGQLLSIPQGAIYMQVLAELTLWGNVLLCNMQMNVNWSFFVWGDGIFILESQ